MLSKPARATAPLAEAQRPAIPRCRRWLSVAVLLVGAAAVSADRCCAQSTPAEPTGLTAEDGNTQVRLRWSGPSDPTITHWQYAWKLSAGSYSDWADMPGSESATRRYTVTGLANNRTYRFKIRAVNDTGPGRESDEATGEPYPAFPAKPAGFQALPGDRKVVLMWDHADDISIQGWEFRRKEAGGRYGSWTAVPGSGADTTTHTVRGLENGTGYVFQIQAFNGAGTGRRSDERSATPMPTAPGKPTGFSVESGNRKAILTWTDPENETISKWQFAYKTTGGYGDWTDMAGSGAATVRHIVAMLANDTAHTFKIRAVNDIGAGAESDEVSATPMARAPEKPVGFTALAGDRQVALSWTDPSDASIVKWQYAYRTTGGYGNWTDISGSSAATTRHVVSGLANGTAHTFKIRAVNDVGPGAESEEASSTPLSRPAKPSGFTAKAGDALVALAWNDPLNSTITGWQYSFRTSGNYGAWKDIEGSHRATTGHSVTDLANGVEHAFKIRAVNASGGGEESDSVSATPQPVPEKPSGLRAEAGNTQARLLWTDPGDSTISGWQYSFRTTGPYGAWKDMPGSGPSTVRHTVTGLSNNTAYTFRLRAVNGSGTGAESDEAAATPREAVPAKPAGFRAESGDSEVSLTWDDPGDASIQGWQFKSRKSDGEYKAQWNDVPGSGAKTVRHTVTGLENGATYIFKIRAFNAANGYESEERSAAPRSPRPAAPAGFSARAGDAEITLAWDSPGDPAITGWQFAVRTTGAFGEWTDIPGSDAATTAYKATGLENGVEHVFKLRAVNEHGGGAESDEAAATPVAVPAKPTGFAATPGDGRVALSWDDPDDATITGWQYALKTTGGYGSWTDITGSGATTTAHTVTGLDNGAAHRFKLRAVNASGSGAESDEAAATPVAVPAKPTGFAATPGDGRVALAWDDPDDVTITGWQYALKTTGDYGSWIDIPDSGATTTAHTVTGLDNGAAHRFKLRALNASGSGAESDEAAVTPVAVPAKPTGFAATPGNGRISLQWSDPGDATITGWQYRYRTTDSYGTWTDIDGSGAETTSHMVTELANGVVHRFEVRAVNGSGPGAPSGETAATPLAVPAKPAGLTATPGSGEVVLEWNDPADATITGWQYNQRPENGEYEADWTAILGSTATTVRHTVTGLETGASYRFKLRADNASGPGAESDEIAATLPPVPVKPAGLTAAAGDGTILLEWTALGDATVAGWQYRYRTTSGYGDWTDIDGSGATTTSHGIVGLENGAPHTFRIRAVNSSGPGLESDEAEATPFAVPAKPTGFTATAGNGEVLLEWDDPGDDTISGYQYTRRKDDGDFEEDWTHIPLPVSRSGRMRYPVGGLENGVSYAFKLRAVNTSGVSEESAVAVASPEEVPEKPTNFTATAGDGQVALRWQSPENPIVGWQHRYKIEGGEFGGWIDMPQTGGDDGFTGHTVTRLTNGVTYFFQVRATNTHGPGPPSETAMATPEPAKPKKPTGLKAIPGYGQVLLTWDAARDPNIRWQYACWLDGKDICSPRIDDSPMENISDPCRRPPWIDVSGSSAATTRHTVPGLVNGVAHAFQVRTVAGDKCSDGSNVAYATPKAAATQAERTTVEALMAGLAGHVAAGAEIVVGERFSADPEAAQVVLAGHEIPLFAPARNETAQRPAAAGRQAITVGMDARETLRKSAFQIPLTDPADDGLPQWSLWHRGELRRFEGSAGPGARFGGRLSSTWFGLDMRLGKRWLFGAALARSEGDLEYGTGAASGAVETALDSVHPYLQWHFEDGRTVWITLGGGQGTIRNAAAGRGVETADAELATVSAGFRSALPAFGGLELSAAGAAGFARLEAKGDARTAIGSLSASTDRQSLGVKAALEEGEAAYYTSLSLRRSGGDGVRGLGLELSGGARSPLPASSGHADIRLRGLVWHSGREYREFGLTATVRQPADPDRGGPSWSLAGAYGALAGGSGKPERLWSRNAPKRGGRALPALDLKAGWRFVLRRSLFEPYAALSLAGANDRKLTLGLDMGPLAGPVLRLAAERRTPRTGGPESRISAALQFRF